MKKIFAVVLTILLILTMFGCDTEKSVTASKSTQEISEAATEVAQAEEAARLAAEQAEEAARVAAKQAAKEAAEKAATEVAAEKKLQEQQASVVPDGDYFITINLSTNKLTLFSNSEFIAAYAVATGKLVNGVSLTPTGKFTILTKVREPAWGGGGYTDPVAGGAPNNPLGHYWMGLSAGSHPGSEYGIHGNIDENSIGTYASHGCIRMHNSEVPILFNTVPKGTKVWIGYSNQLTDWGVKNFQ